MWRIVQIMLLGILIVRNFFQSNSLLNQINFGIGWHVKINLPASVEVTVVPQNTFSKKKPNI